MAGAANLNILNPNPNSKETFLWNVSFKHTKMSKKFKQFYFATVQTSTTKRHFVESWEISETKNKKCFSRDEKVFLLFFGQR